MKHQSIVFLLILILCMVPGGAFSQKKEKKTDLPQLPEKYRKWLMEEVVYIITPIEKQIFTQLGSDRERETFITAFWRQRDPNPNTPENEFKREHYERIDYSNNWFGRESPEPGWRTDMGKTHILLGTPHHIERFENTTGIYPFVTWFYQGMSHLGLPDAFYVAFFKKDGFGEFELYTPIRYGPQYLLHNYSGSMSDYESAYYKVHDIEPSVANVALTLIPNEKTGTSPSMASEILIKQQIPSAPQKKINSIYAEKFLRYKDSIEVEYTANYIENSNLVEVIQGANGLHFVHFLIEPRRLTLEEYQGNFGTTLEIVGSVLDQKNQVVFQFHRRHPIELDRGQLAQIREKLFSFQDLFPLIPGKYKLNILLKNTVSREFTSIEKQITVPEDRRFRLQSIFLANRLNETSPYAGQMKPFLFGSRQLLPAPRHDFSRKDTLVVFTQIVNLPPDVRKGGFVSFRIFNERSLKIDQEKSRPLAEIPDPEAIIESLPLQELLPSNYRLQVAVLTAEKKELIVDERGFFISPLEGIPRPWVLSLPLAASANSQIDHDIGIQYFNRGDLGNAGKYLEKAFQDNPESLLFIEDLCKLLNGRGEHDRVKTITQPLVANEKYISLLLPLGDALRQSGDFSGAIDRYHAYITHFGLVYTLLNHIGDCYERLGNLLEAQAAWKKSLEMNASQPQLRKKLDAIKGNGNEKPPAK